MPPLHYTNYIQCAKKGVKELSTRLKDRADRRKNFEQDSPGILEFLKKIGENPETGLAPQHCMGKSTSPPLEVSNRRT